MHDLIGPVAIFVIVGSALAGVRAVLPLLRAAPDRVRDLAARMEPAPVVDPDAPQEATVEVPQPEAPLWGNLSFDIYDSHD